MAFENDIKLTSDNYTIYVNQDDDDAVIDVFMETNNYDDNHSEPSDLQDRRIMMDKKLPPYGYAFVILTGLFMIFW